MNYVLVNKREIVSVCVQYEGRHRKKTNINSALSINELIVSFNSV